MKKTLLTLTLMCMVSISNAQTYHLDVNGNGTIDVTDAMLIVDYILGKPLPKEGGESQFTCPDSNHPHLIDLGLPSGTKWACCNVAASTPIAYGGYFAWGETGEKNTYTSSNYTFSASDTHDLTAAEDVATVKWGDNYRMPADFQLKELLNYCTWTWEKVENTMGVRVTGPNQNSIFLPAAGYKENTDNYIGSYGSYWGRTHQGDPRYASELVVNNTSGNLITAMGSSANRYSGRSVRPVYKDIQPANNDYTICIANPSFENNDLGGWDGTPFGSANPDNNAEHFSKNYDTYKTITGLTPGDYVLGVQGFYRKGNYPNDYNLWVAGDKDNNNAIIYAVSSVGSYSVPFVAMSSVTLKQSLGGRAVVVGDNLYVPDDMQAASAWFNAGYYKNTLNVKVGADGVLTIGIKKDKLIDRDWTMLDNWTLIKK